MKCVINQPDLLKSLRLVQGIVEPRPLLPVLSRVLLATEGAVLRVTATDTETTVRVTVPGEALTQGRVTLPARTFADLVRELPPLPVTLEAETPAWITVSCARVRARLAGGPPEDFPDPNLTADGRPVTLPAETLATMLVQTSFAIPPASDRYTLTGLLMELAETTLTMVATDGHRLALARRAVQRDSPEPAAGIVPRKAVQCIGRLLQAAHASAKLTLAERAFAFTMPGITLTTRLIDGRFPNYQQVIPSASPVTLTVPSEALRGALRRVSVLGETDTRGVRFALTPGALTLTSTAAEAGEAEETLPVEHSGEPLSLGVNARYLLEALAPLETERAVLELTDPLRPILVRPETDAETAPETLSVIMPLRV